MLTSPAGVWKIIMSAGLRSASATADAIVACPQNGTSCRGAKYRTSKTFGSSARGDTNAVSE